MKKASEYREHAKECRALARRMKESEQREQMLALAEIWEALAVDRKRLQEGPEPPAPAGALR
jgi:hypothetical protein